KDYTIRMITNSNHVMSSQYNDICVHILTNHPYTSLDCLFLPSVGWGRYICPYKKLRGSVMCPHSAVAAAVAGLPRYISAVGSPMRPVKLRFIVVKARSPGASTPKCRQIQGPKPGG